MNLRISEGELRFRISQEERTMLESGEMLSLTVGLPGGNFIETRLGGEQQGKFVARPQEGGLQLHWPVRGETQSEMRLPEGHILKLILEVDLFSKKKKN